MLKYYFYKLFFLLPSHELRFIKKTKKIFGFYPRQFNLYKIAFTHKSYLVNKNFKGLKLDNERLEYLGDAVIGAVISEILYDTFPDEHEGFLTKLRSKIVNRKSLNNIAYNLGIRDMIKSEVEIKQDSHLLGNALEAVIGALYLDKGNKKVKTFFLRLIKQKYIDIHELKYELLDFKSKLFEWSLKNKIHICFETEPVDMDEKNPLFFVSNLKVKGIDEQFSSSSSTKKEAQKKAAKKAILWLNAHPNFLHIS